MNSKNNRGGVTMKTLKTMFLLCWCLSLTTIVFANTVEEKLEIIQAKEEAAQQLQQDKLSHQKALSIEQKQALIKEAIENMDLSIEFVKNHDKYELHQKLMVEMDKFDLINEDIESIKIKVYEKIKTQEAAFLKQNIEKFDIEQKHIAKEKRANAEMLNDNIAKFELEESKIQTKKKILESDNFR